MQEGFDKYLEHIFQFTPLREGRPPPPWNSSKPRTFQFTPLREGRRVTLVPAVLLLIQFQFTPLREGRPPFKIKENPLSPYFNSRPCERGDGKIKQN